MSKIIMGIRLEQRVETAPDFQSVLTNYGCYIQTRLGVHQASVDSCSPHGIIILELVGDADDKAKELEHDLLKIKGVEIRKMMF